MKMLYLILLVVLSACSQDKPIPRVHPDDPTWALKLDHLDPGELK